MIGYFKRWFKVMAEIRPNSDVQLKSGGPRMTVEAIRDNRAKCGWFDEKNQRQSAEFELSLLTLAGPSVMTVPVRESQRTRGF
jgi:uncharacterized protein YodC (DUF2158 family)